MVQILGECHFPLGHLVEKRGSLLHCTGTEGLSGAFGWKCPLEASKVIRAVRVFGGVGWDPEKTTTVVLSVASLGQLALLEAAARAAL